MTSGPVVVQVVSGDGGVASYRALMGDTDPEKAAPGTLRREFTESIGANAVRGSDSAPTAEPRSRSSLPLSSSSADGHSRSASGIALRLQAEGGADPSRAERALRVQLPE